MYTAATSYSGRLSLARPLFALASAMLILLLAALMLRPGSYLNSGNLHDLLIPYNSALAAEQGLVLHQDFHTPFGWVYSRLNHAGWLLTGAPGGLFTANDLIVVTSLGWTLAVLVAYLLLAFTVPASDRRGWITLWLVGQFIVFVSFSFRGLSSLSVRDVTWYGTYNNHLWALIFLQLSSLALFLRAGPGRAMLLQVALLQSLCVALSLNYKLSFGLASLLLAGAVLLAGWPGWRWRIAYAVSLAAIAWSVSLLLAPDAYSYSLYLKDLGYALRAKSEKTADLSLLPSLACFALVTATLFWQSAQDRPGSLTDALKSSAHRGELFRTAMLGAMLAASLSIGTAGDFARPYHYMVAAVAILVLLGPRLAISRSSGRIPSLVAVAVLSALLLQQLQTDFRIARYKTAEYENDRYLPVHFDTPYGRLSWIAGATSSYDSLTRMTRLGQHPALAEIVADLAYPRYEGKRPIPPAFFNGDYVASLEAAKRMTEPLPGIRRMNVVMLGFTNPMPMLLGSPMPANSFHWLHYGTSVPGTDPANHISSQWKNADLVIVPAASVSRYGQWLMNCKFLTWNESNGRPFAAFAVDRFHLYYSRTRFGPPLPELQEGQLAQRCDDLLDKYRAGLLKP